ncbi:hypothetical protein [Okeania sp.]|nr:hypothetical protein [Okeania sp.]MEB3341345.1 hypothetical protein [Okeania sp.]
MLLNKKTKGTILDATAIIDFRWLNEWEWLQKYYIATDKGMKT